MAWQHTNDNQYNSDFIQKMGLITDPQWYREHTKLELFIIKEEQDYKDQSSTIPQQISYYILSTNSSKQPQDTHPSEVASRFIRPPNRYITNGAG